MVEATCLRCKTKIQVVDPVEKVAKNSRIYFTGKCPDCGGGVSVFAKGAAKDATKAKK
jgi:hypothetical protein